MRQDLRERFAGIDRLYGRGAVERLAARHVAVVGLGGVGSWAAEALARTAVGKLTLVDADDLCVSNTNRQLPAVAGQYGRAKVEAMAERCRAINPAIEIEPVERTSGASLLTLSPSLPSLLHGQAPIIVEVETVEALHCALDQLLTVEIGGSLASRAIG